ncbi:MAG: S-layer homology domain-containing protein [Clostridia bacterium]|nr:S-layer homology domain-containing protein [Clostridia bacterium]
MKRTIALILALLMVCSCLPVFAASKASEQKFSTDSLKGEIIIENPALAGDGWKDSTLSFKHKWTTNSGAMATYAVEGIAAGNYEAYFWLIPHKNDALTIDIYVDHNGKTSKSTLYQKLNADETVEAGWVSFGVFDFAKDGDQKIYTPCLGGNIRATKMRLVPTKAAVTGTGDAKFEGQMPATPAPDASAGDNVSADNATHEGEVIYHYKKAEVSAGYADSTTLKNFDGGSQAWNNKKGETIKYTATGIKPGNYEIYYYIIPHDANAEKMTFTVSHNGKTTDIFCLQNPLKGGPKDAGWVSMGVLDFAGTGDETFLHTNPGGGHTRGTGLKLVPTDKEVGAGSAAEAPVQVGTVPEAVYVSGKPAKVNVPHGDSQLKDISVDPMGSVTYEGSWTFSSAVPGPMKNAANSMWIAAENANGGKATVTYNPDIMAVGDVNIFVYLLWWKENQNTRVKYEVHHNGKVDEIVLDPTALNESSWVNLGTFDFAGKSDEEFVKLVAVDNETLKANTRASTIMFEIVNTEGGIWQTRYVTPVYDATEEMEAKLKSLAKLDKFDDMVEHWAHYDVEYMANEGLISGVADNLFDPEANITRAEYLTILDRAMGYELITGESYPDVAQDAWYATYVATAKANGLIEGLPVDDGFKPEQPITREEMALFAYNAIKATKKDDAWVANMPDVWGNFSDTAEISDWAKEALRYLIQTEIIKGTSETTVEAKANATRAQGAVILKRFMQLFVWAGPPVDQEWELMFYDEFLGNEVNWGVWRSDASSPGHIQSSRWPENVEQHDGSLHLVIRKEERGGKQWTAGSVWARPEVFAQTYGYWEARYKIAAAPGINNSFWTYVPHGHNIHKDPDPLTHYELDINEGHYPNEMATNYHTWVTGERKQHSKAFKFEYDLSQDYHTYALEWTPEKLIFYFDGVAVREQENYNAHQLQYPYLSSAVLNWAGQITDEADGTAQIIDYVRIWQTKANANDPKLNYKGEPMVGVGPADQGPTVSKPSISEELGIEIPTVAVKDQAVDKETYAGEIIVPAEVEGKWDTSSFAPNYDGGSHKWSNTVGAKSTYDLSGVKAGKYKIYMWRLPHMHNIGQMDMLLYQDGKNTLAGSVALKLAEGETAEPGWVLIGEQEIKGGADCYIHYTCTGTNCRATAVKLVPVK